MPGLIDVDQLVLTNTLGLFEFNGGTLHTGGTTNSNGHAFIVGSGTSAATLQMQGGTHVFANQLFIANNASLVGNGTVIGTLIVAGGGNLIPARRSANRVEQLAHAVRRGHHGNQQEWIGV